MINPEMSFTNGPEAEDHSDGAAKELHFATSKEPSRRTFLSAGGAAIAGCALMGCHAKKDPGNNLLKAIKIIDMHVHHQKQRKGIDELFANEDACGIDMINILGMPVASEKRMALFMQNPSMALAKLLRPGKIYAFPIVYDYCPGISIDKIDYAGQVKSWMEMGFDGVKMVQGKPSVYKEIGGIGLDSPLLDTYYSLIEEKNLALVSHVGDTPELWDKSKAHPNAAKFGWNYWDGTYPTMEKLRSEVNNILSKFPNLRLILAHFYYMGDDLGRLASFFDQFPQVSVDLTPGDHFPLLFEQDTQKVRDFFVKYQDRIMLGSDNTGGIREIQWERDFCTGKITGMRQFLEYDGEFEWKGRHHGIALDRLVLEKIYSKNFESYVASAPRPVNIPAVLENCTWISSIYQKHPSGQGLLKDLKAVVEQIEQLS